MLRDVLSTAPQPIYRSPMHKFQADSDPISVCVRRSLEKNEVLHGAVGLPSGWSQSGGAGQASAIHIDGAFPVKGGSDQRVCPISVLPELVWVRLVLPVRVSSHRGNSIGTKRAATEAAALPSHSFSPISAAFDRAPDSLPVQAPLYRQNYRLAGAFWRSRAWHRVQPHLPCSNPWRVLPERRQEVASVSPLADAGHAPRVRQRRHVPNVLERPEPEPVMRWPAPRAG